MPVFRTNKGHIAIERHYTRRGPTGPAGKDAEGSIVSGDLSGTLHSPTVVGLQDRSVADIAPVDQQFLGWEAAGSRWMPASITIDIIVGLQDALDGKEDSLTFDLVPIDGSANPVESNGIFNAINVVQSDINLQRSITKEPTGFFEPKNVIVTYDSTARTITLTGNVQGYWRGVQIPALVSGWVSPAHATGDGVFYLYHNGTEFVWSTTLWEFSYLHIARVVIENSGAIKIAFRECHGFQPAPSHHNDHQNIGTWRTDGTGLIPDSSYALDSTAPTDRRPDINLCELHDEDLRSSLPALTSKLYSWWYQSGTDIVLDADHSEIINTSGDQPYWNENVSGVWQWTLFPNNHYGKIFVAAIPVTADADSQKYRYAFVPPQGTSNTLTGAKAFNTLSLDLGWLVEEIKEIVFIAEIIIQYTASEWSIKEINEIVGSRATQITVSGSAAGQIASAIAAHAEETATHGVGEIVGSTESQELTGKILDSYTNFIGADHVHIRAKALENILKGQPVYVTGYNSGENAQEIVLANNAIAPANGIAAKDILVGEFGFFITSGVVSGFDTTAWDEGDILYVDGTGVLVNVDPLTGWQQPIAEVLRSNSQNGAIQVSAGYPKQDSSDVRHTPGVSVADKFSQIDADLDALEQTTYTADQIAETATREFISPTDNEKISAILQITIDLLQDPNAQLESLHTDGSPIFDGIIVGRSAYPPTAFFATGGETVDDGRIDLYLKAQNASAGTGGTIIIGAGSGPSGPGVISLEGEVYSGVLNIGSPVIAGVDLSGGVDTLAVSGAPDKLCSSKAVKASLDSLAVTCDWSDIQNKPSTFAPDTHAITHQSGGADAIKLDDLAAPDDTTDLDATASMHGLMSKADKSKLDGISSGADATGFVGNLTTSQFNEIISPVTGQWGFNIDQRGTIWRYNGSVWVPDKYGICERPAEWWTSHDFKTEGATGPDGWEYTASGVTPSNAEITANDEIRINTVVAAGSYVSIKKDFSVNPLDIFEISELLAKWYLDANYITFGSADGDICCSVKLETGNGDYFEAIYSVAFDGTESLKLRRSIGEEGLIDTAGTPEAWISNSGYDETFGTLVFDSRDNISFLHGDRGGQGQNDEEYTENSYRFQEGTSVVNVSFNVFADAAVTSSTREIDVLLSNIFIKIDR